MNGDEPEASDREAFRRWRRSPGADAAYSRVEAAWRRLAPLAAHPDVRQVLQASTTKREHPWWGRGGSWEAELAIAGVAVAALLLIMSRSLWLGQPYSTPVGGRQTLSLSDGSRLLLDADTRLRIRMSPHNRSLVLERGRVLIDVAHDLSRPFVVDAGATRVTALGTRFTVRRMGDDAGVVLLRGDVEVRSRGRMPGRWRLGPGQAVDPRRPTPHPADLPVALGWTAGRIVLQNATPSEAVAEIDRYAKTTVRLDPALASAPPLTGVFDAGDPDAFVTAVTRLRGWSAEPQTDGSILLKPRR